MIQVILRVLISFRLHSRLSMFGSIWKFYRTFSASNEILKNGNQYIIFYNPANESHMGHGNIPILNKDEPIFSLDFKV